MYEFLEMNYSCTFCFLYLSSITAHISFAGVFRMVFKIIKNFYGKFGIFILFLQFFIKHIHFSTLKIAWFKIHLPRIPCSRLSLIVDW